MTRYGGRHWLLAIGVSAIAGYVDAIGFLKLGGLFVSFMSGNSTRMAVGFVAEPHVALTAARLLAGFVAGVIAGTLLAMAAGPYRKPVLLGFVGIVLALAASSGVGLSDTLATRPSRPEAAILVILENTSGTGWLLLTIAHARNDVPLR